MDPHSGEDSDKRKQSIPVKKSHFSTMECVWRFSVGIPINDNVVESVDVLRHVACREVPRRRVASCLVPDDTW